MSLWIVGSLIGAIMISQNNKIDKIKVDTIYNKLENFFDQIIYSSNELEQLKNICIFLFLWSVLLFSSWILTFKSRTEVLYIMFFFFVS